MTGSPVTGSYAEAKESDDLLREALWAEAAAFALLGVGMKPGEVAVLVDAKHQQFLALDGVELV